MSGSNASVLQKTSKPNNAIQRIDLEPLYTSLKIAIGDHWTEYKEAVSLYILGLPSHVILICSFHFEKCESLTFPL